MTPRLIGEHPLAKDEQGRLKTCIGTIFPADRVVVALPKMSHMMQRQAYLDLLDHERVSRGEPPLDPSQRQAKWFEAVDLIMEQEQCEAPLDNRDQAARDGADSLASYSGSSTPGSDSPPDENGPEIEEWVFLRPDPDEMPLAFAADELLRELQPPVPVWQVRFQAVRNNQVYQPIKLRGQCWRITPLPQSPEQMQQMITAARTRLGGQDIYYYNKTSGTRLLTCDAFTRLSGLGSEELREHLIEIQRFCREFNRQGNPEISFFLAGESFSKNDWAVGDFSQFSHAELTAAHSELARKFTQAVPVELRQENPADPQWRGRMFAALIGERDEVVPEETMLGLSSEFFMQIKWLPGARFDDGELLLDPCFFESVPDVGRSWTWNQNPLGFIFNFVREFGTLEYVNVGQVVGSMSRGRKAEGRREVYIAVLKTPDSPKEIVKIIRMQKRGVWEHLDQGQDLLQAVLKSESYTEYVLDRRLACRQLGMNLTQRILACKVRETYRGQQTRYRDMEILSPYFERDYLAGIASDKIPVSRFQRDGYALRLATLLGQAAASNLIVGRCGTEGTDGAVVFDDGDELVVETADGLPDMIVLADQMGTFNNCTTPLVEFAPEYAKPVNNRLDDVPDPAAFATAYLDGLATQFRQIQEHYGRCRGAFDALFRHRRLGAGAKIALRWTEVLRRLDESDPQELVARIRERLAPACRA